MKQSHISFINEYYIPALFLTVFHKTAATVRLIF